VDQQCECVLSIVYKNKNSLTDADISDEVRLVTAGSRRSSSETRYNGRNCSWKWINTSHYWGI